jgi:hypothetical protein
MVVTEDYYHLGCDAMWSGRCLPKFWGSICLHLMDSNPSKQQEVNRVAGLAVCFLLTIAYSLTLKTE